MIALIEDAPVIQRIPHAQRALGGREHLNNLRGVPPDVRPLDSPFHRQWRRKAPRVGDDVNEFRKNLSREGKRVPGLREFLKPGSRGRMRLVRADLDRHQEGRVESHASSHHLTKQIIATRERPQRLPEIQRFHRADARSRTNALVAEQLHRFPDQFSRWAVRPAGVLDEIFVDRFRYIDGDGFNLDVPTVCPDVPVEVLQPRNTWAKPADYDTQAAKLARMFAAFKTFEAEVTAEVKAAGPRL